MIVVKLGGSVLTTKNGPRRVRTRVLGRLAKELAAAREPLVVVHGGGSFGHGEASKWGLRGADASTSKARRVPRARLAKGAEHVHEAMADLDVPVLAALLRAGLQPTALPGGLVATLRDGRLARFDPARFRSALANGLVPVTYGDAAPDLARGHAIVSGDQLAWALAKRLRPARVVFVTDRDGLYTAPPGARGARLAKRLRARDLGVLAATSGDGTHDVTGGMEGKLKEIGRIGRLGIPVTVVNGLVAGRLAAVVGGRRAIGTLVVP